MLGLADENLSAIVLAPGMALGILFLCLLPSTIQSSITFTSIARGNVAAAVCSASASNVLGVFLTPLLMGLLMNTQGAFLSSAIGEVVVQLLVPFVVGHLARPWIGQWVTASRMFTGIVDRGAILLVVYYAFGEAVINGLWHQLAPLIWSFSLSSTASFSLRPRHHDGGKPPVRILAARRNRYRVLRIEEEPRQRRADREHPFSRNMIGAIILPLMLFHQIQLMVCAVSGARLCRRSALAGCSIAIDDRLFRRCEGSATYRFSASQLLLSWLPERRVGVFRAGIFD